MGTFDFLTGQQPNNTTFPPGAQPGATGGIMNTLTALLQDPNILAGLGDAGSALSSGASIGEALNPSEMIRRMQMQKAGANIIRRRKNSYGSVSEALQGLGQTPGHMPGPNTLNVKSDGKITTTTVTEPSPITGDSSSLTDDVTGSGGQHVPFFRALFQ